MATSPRFIPAASLVVILCATLGVSGCSTDKIPFVYRLDIEQGNVVEQAMVAQLEPGMSRDQVRFIMGSPMLIDPFSDERWDYIYTFSAGGERREQRNLTLLFEGDALARVVGDVRRAEGEIVLDDSGPQEVDVPPGKPGRNRGLLANLFSSGPSEEELAALRKSAQKRPEDQLPNLPQDEAQEETEEQVEERRERARAERRRENQEEFYEELLDDLEL